MNDFTRFRAYQLGTKGSLCSYAVDANFTLIEARLNENVVDSLKYELIKSGCEHITSLDITSWDSDHCNYGELEIILNSLKPSRVEWPGYIPDTENGKRALSVIKKYLNDHNFVVGTAVSDKYIDGLTNATQKQRTNILYNPIEISECHNDNSVVTLYRYGRFSVLSLGDCESKDIADRLISSEIIKNEVDVLILAHHGADNGFTTKEFLTAINPRVAICTSDRGNMYGHPDEKVRKLLWDCDIPLLTTKEGDVLVTCGEDNNCKAYNMVGNNDRVRNMIQFNPKLIINY